MFTKLTEENQSNSKALYVNDREFQEITRRARHELLYIQITREILGREVQGTDVNKYCRTDIGITK